MSDDLKRFNIVEANHTGATRVVDSIWATGRVGALRALRSISEYRNWDFISMKEAPNRSALFDGLCDAIGEWIPGVIRWHVQPDSPLPDIYAQYYLEELVGPQDWIDKALHASEQRRTDWWERQSGWTFAYVEETNRTVRDAANKPTDHGLRPLEKVGQYDKDPILYQTRHIVSGPAFDFHGAHWTVERLGEVYTRWGSEEEAETTAMFWNEPRGFYDWYTSETTPLEGWPLVVEREVRIDLIVENIYREHSNDEMLRILLRELDSWFLPFRKPAVRGCPISLKDPNTYEDVDGVWWSSMVQEAERERDYFGDDGVYHKFVGPPQKIYSKDNAEDLLECFRTGMEHTEMDTGGYISSFGCTLGYHKDYHSFVDMDDTWEDAMWFVQGSLDWTNSPEILKEIKQENDVWQAMLVRNDLLMDDGHCDFGKLSELKKNGRHH